MEDEQYYRQLIRRYAERKATDEELQVFLQLLKQGKLDKYLAEAMNADAGITADDEISPVKRKISPMWRVAAAAAILFVISTILIFSLPKHPEQKLPETSYGKPKPIPPGSNRATLTLANGQKIDLTEAQTGQIAIQQHTSVTRTADGRIIYDDKGGTSAEMLYNTIATPRGGQWPEIQLPDGSKVILDASSSIKYPVAFNGKDRMVEITGQAYFEVKHDPNHPFKVKAGEQLIEDIGTSFNINAYSDEPQLATTLIEGSISIAADRQRVVLTPGQQACTNSSGSKIRIKKVNVGDVIAWKNGQTSFEGESIEEIMRQVSRWYDVDIVYEGKLPERHFVGGVPRNANLDDLLKALAFENIHITLENKKLHLKP